MIAIVNAIAVFALALLADAVPEASRWCLALVYLSIGITVFSLWRTGLLPEKGRDTDR